MLRSANKLLKSKVRLAEICVDLTETILLQLWIKICFGLKYVFMCRKNFFH